jgi:ubiquinone/menaquinone biosynthesis C-methylase UbiE
MTRIYSVVRFVVRLAIFVIVWRVALGILRRFFKFPAPSFLSVFLDSPLRKAIQPPAQVVDWARVEPGMHVLELGPGPGTFTLEIAGRVGDSGRVTAVDISPAMIARLEAKLEKAGAPNVTARVAEAYELPLPDSSVDRVFMVTVLAEIPGREQALAEIQRVLKPDGLLAVGEFIVDPDFPLPQTVTGWCRQSGFQLVDLNGNLVHYVALFKKSSAA